MVSLTEPFSPFVVFVFGVIFVPPLAEMHPSVILSVIHLVLLVGPGGQFDLDILAEFFACQCKHGSRI